LATLADDLGGGELAEWPANLLYNNNNAASKITLSTKTDNKTIFFFSQTSRVCGDQCCD